MKVSFPLENPPHKPPQVVAAIKHKVRKYLKREARKPLPDEVAYWDFDCRTGKAESDAIATAPGELMRAIDIAAAGSWDAIYIEIIAKAGPAKAKKEKKKRKGSAYS